MQISVILVNWNQSTVTVKCIESLFQNTKDDPAFSFHVIIVDNNSQIESIQYLENYLAEKPNKPVHLIKNPVNTGFAGGNNAGIRYALNEFHADYIWLLNNDIIVQPDALNFLVQAATQHPEIKIWGCTIFELFPELHFHCAGGFSYNALLSIPTPISFPKDQSSPMGIYYPLPEMDYPAGAAMFVKASTFKETGLLNEVYFLYYEELDFVHQIGGKKSIAWCPNSVLHHESGSSTGSKDPNTGDGSWIGHYYGNLSALKYTWLYHRWYFPVVFLFRLLGKSVLFVSNKDYAGFRPLKRAYIDFFKWLVSRFNAH